MGLSVKAVLTSHEQLYWRRIFCSACNIVEPRVQQSLWFTASSRRECQFYDYSRSSSFHFFIRELVADPAAAKLFNGEHMHLILRIVEPLMIDADKFKQAAAAEILTGLLRGILPALYCCIHI